LRLKGKHQIIEFERKAATICFLQIIELERKAAEQGQAVRGAHVGSWASADVAPEDMYFLDSRGDRNNLVYNGLYRADIAAYHRTDPGAWLGEPPSIMAGTIRGIFVAIVFVRNAFVWLCTQVLSSASCFCQYECVKLLLLPSLLSNEPRLMWKARALSIEH